MNTTHLVMFFLGGASATADAASIVGGCMSAGAVYLPGVKAGMVYLPGVQVGDEYLPGVSAGERVC